MPEQPVQGYKPVLSFGPFLGLNTTRSPFWLEEGAGAVVSNVDIATEPGGFVTTLGRELVGKVQLLTGYKIISVTPFASFAGTDVGEVCFLVYCAFNSLTGGSYAGYVDPVSGFSGDITKVQPFTQAVQFGDTLYTNGGDRILFTPDGGLAQDTWQIQVDTRLPYKVNGSAATLTGGQGGTVQYAYTVRRAAKWRTNGGAKGVQASWNGYVTCVANGYLTFSLVYGSETFTTQQVSFTRDPQKATISIAELSTQVAQEMVSTINGDAQIGQLVTAYNGQSPNVQTNDPNIYVQVNKAGADGNNYSGYLTITDTTNGNSASPTAATAFTGGSDQGGSETTLDPDLATYQESSPVLTPTFEVANDSNHTPCFLIPPNITPQDLISGLTSGGETYYGVLYRSSFLNPSYVMVDYLINLNQATDVNGKACFKDPYTDEEIQNNIILTMHNDPPPVVGQVYPGPALSNLNTLNGGNPSYFQQSDLKESFGYQNPIIIGKHQTRMFAFTLYPLQPLRWQKGDGWRNRVQLQPQLWYSDYGIPWAFDDVNQLLLVGTEDSAGNYQYDQSNGVPWSPTSQLTDIPVAIASTGSLLVVFKRRETFCLFGDSPQEFQQSLREGFAFGAYGADAVTPAEGGVFWLCDSPIDFFFFDGNTPSPISEDIRDDLVTLYNIGELEACSTGYDGNHVLCASFAASTNPDSPAYGDGITYCYSTIEQKWFTLPYGGLLFDTPVNAISCGIAHPLDGADNFWALSYLRSSVQDLNENVVATWQTGVTMGQRRGVRKVFKQVVLIAPTQEADATVTVFIDGVQKYQQTWQLDAKDNPNVSAEGLPWARTGTINPADGEGYSAYATLVVTNRSTTDQATVYACDITYEEKGGLQSTSSFDGTYTNVSP